MHLKIRTGADAIFGLLTCLSASCSGGDQARSPQAEPVKPPVATPKPAPKETMGPGPVALDVFHPDVLAGTPQPKAAWGGRVIVHMASMPENLSYPIENSAYTRRILREVHEFLIKRDWESWEWGPSLADKWEVEEVLASDLPPRRKMYEFFARRFIAMRKGYDADPAAFRMYVEIGEEHFEQVRSYVDLADHYLGVIIGEAMGEGFFAGLGVDETISLVNQMVAPYCSIPTMIMLMERLSEEKLARIIDAVFDGLSAQDRGAKGLTGLRAA